MNACCTIEELSKLLNISYSKAYSLVINEEIDSFYIGPSDRRISREAVEKFMNIKNGLETEKEKTLREEIKRLESQNLKLKEKLNSILLVLI